MPASGPLTLDLLGELEDRWRRADAPILDLLLPGLSGADIDELLEPVGLAVPAEARLWWSWHDVDPAGPGTYVARAMTGTGWAFSRLSESVRDVLVRREQAAAIARDHGNSAGESLWRSTWLPVAAQAHGGLCVVDCADPGATASPVNYVEWPGGDDADDPPRAQSLGEVVGWWIEAFDDGSFFLDPTLGGLNAHDERLGRRRSLLRLV